MLSTMYYYTDKAIYYRTPKFTDGWRFDFDEFSKHHVCIANSRPFSTILSELMKSPTHSPDCVYHFAGLIKKREPHIDWGFEEQLLDFEKQIRLKKYSNAIYKEMEIPGRPTFQSDYHMIDFEIEFGSRLKTLESDECLQRRVTEKIAFWLNRST